MKIWLRKNMTEEERARFNVLIKEVKEKHEMRTEEEKQILLESFRPKSEKVVHSKEKEKEWLISYTNINGIVSILSEIIDYLRTKKPDIFSLLETKLNDSEDVPVGEGQYNV